METKSFELIKCAIFRYEGRLLAKEGEWLRDRFTCLGRSSVSTKGGAKSGVANESMIDKIKVKEVGEKDKYKELLDHVMGNLRVGRW